MCVYVYVCVFLHVLLLITFVMPLFVFSVCIVTCHKNEIKKFIIRKRLLLQYDDHLAIAPMIQWNRKKKKKPPKWRTNTENKVIQRSLHFLLFSPALGRPAVKRSSLFFHFSLYLRVFPILPWMAEMSIGHLAFIVYLFFFFSVEYHGFFFFILI